MSRNDLDHVWGQFKNITVNILTSSSSESQTMKTIIPFDDVFQHLVDFVANWNEKG